MAKPKPWKVLEVFGREVPVYRVQGLITEGCYGFYETEQKYIGVDASLTGETETHTLMHELMHSAMDRLFLQQQLDDKFAEVLIENLCEAVMKNFKVGVK